MRWLPLTALVLVASCSTLWNDCTAPDQQPCDYASLAKNSCQAGTSCAPSGVCEPIKDAGLDGGGDCPPSTSQPLVKADCRVGFCWENPLSQGNDLRAVWGATANQVWAVGNAGTIGSRIFFSSSVAVL